MSDGSMKAGKWSPVTGEIGPVVDLPWSGLWVDGGDKPSGMMSIRRIPVYTGVQYN